MKHTPPKWKVKRWPRPKWADGFVTIVADSRGNGLFESTTAGENEKVEANAKLIAAAPEMLELLKDILVEVRPEISRINTDAGQTIFNPVATETIDMAKELISKAEGK